jgi:hypothetical protein
MWNTGSAIGRRIGLGLSARAAKPCRKGRLTGRPGRFGLAHQKAMRHYYIQRFEEYVRNLERYRRRSVLFPRFRSKERDVRSDVERLTLVQNSILKVIGEVEQELAGLTARIEDARARAAFLYGDMIEGESDDNARDAAILADAERILVRGDRRIEEIHHNLSFLIDLRNRMSAETARLQAYVAEGE